MSETPTVPTLNVQTPSAKELEQMVYGQPHSNSYEENPVKYFHAWENQGVHSKALEAQDGVIELDPDKSDIDFKLWEEEMNEPEEAQHESALWQQEVVTHRMTPEEISTAAGNIRLRRWQVTSQPANNPQIEQQSFLKKTMALFTGGEKDPTRRLRRMTERQLIEMESEIGRELFGPIPADHDREFFCLDNNTWVWHEGWVDVATGQKRSSTTRYEVNSNGILKVQDGANYRYLDGQELDNFAVATRMYYERVMRDIYATDPYTSRPLSQEAPATI